MQPDPAETSIEPVGPAFADVIAQIHAEAFSTPWPAEAFRKLLPDPIRTCFLAKRGAEPAGMLLLQCVADEAEILTIGVRPAFRRSGLGDALVRAAFGVAKARGCTRIFLEVADGNHAARALYDSFGFEVVGRRSGYYHEGETVRDAHILEAALSCEAHL